MGAKSLASASLWTILMMDKAGLFIAYAALSLKPKKSSYFKPTLQPRGCAQTPQHGIVREEKW